MNNPLKHLLSLACIAGLFSCTATAQTSPPAPTVGSTAFTVKNAGAGSTTLWVEPVAPPSVFGITSLGAHASFSLNTAHFEIVGGYLQLKAGAGGGTWGSITGTLSAQSDLAAALAAKAPLASPTFTGTVTIPPGAAIAGYLTEADAEMAFVDFGDLADFSGSTNITALGTINAGVWNGTAIPVTHGGTGSNTAAGARSALGLGTLATQSANIGDYLTTANAASAYVALGGTYANPSWLTSLDWSKIFNNPPFMEVNTYDPQTLGYISGINGGADNDGTGGTGGFLKMEGGFGDGVLGGDGGDIDTSGINDVPGGDIITAAGGSINTSGTGSIQLGALDTRTTILGAASSSFTLTLPTTGGSSGQVLTRGSGTSLTWTTPAGTGDVVGPESNNVDGEIVVFDGTTGKLLKASGSTLFSYADKFHATSHLTGGDDEIGAATASNEGLMTAAYASKLNGIEASADVTDAANVAAAGAAMTSATYANPTWITSLALSKVVGTGDIGATQLASTAVTPGSYTSADITVDADGRITAASNGSGGGSGPDMSVHVSKGGTNQSIVFTADTPVQVTFGTEILDTDSRWSSNALTVSAGEIWEITGSLSMGALNNGQNHRVKLFKDGSLLHVLNDLGLWGASPVGLSFHTLIFEAGTYDIRAELSTSGTRDVFGDAAKTYFKARRIK